MRARRRSNFLSLRRKKVTKERATLLSATPSLRCGATWVLRCRVRRGTHFAAAQLRSDNPGEPDNKACVSCGTHTTPHPARPGAYRREPKKTGFTPFWLRRGAQGMADQGSRLFERRRREFERDPASTEHHRLPRRCAPGSQAAGSPSFAFFSWRDKKRRCPAGGTSRPPPSAQAVRPAPRRRAHKNPTKNPSSARVTSATSYKLNSTQPLSDTHTADAPSRRATHQATCASQPTATSTAAPTSHWPRRAWSSSR